jgi:hypothetical protein
VRDDGVPGKGVQEIQNFIRDVIYRLNHKVTGTHRRIEDLDIEQLVYKRSPSLLYRRSVLIFADLFAFLLGEIDRVSMPLLRLAELWTHGIELFLHHRTNGVLDDVFNDMVGRVIGTGRFALVFVVFEIDLSFFLYPFLALGTRS